jgi:hypothetical protein
MAVTIKPGTERRVVREAARITLQVKVPPADQAAAEAALQDLADYLSSMGDEEAEYEAGSEPPSPNFVSDVIAVPGGPVLFVDAHDLPRRVLAELPGWLASALERRGATDAVIQVPRFTYNLAVRASLHDENKNGLGLTVYPAGLVARLPNPDAWLDIAERWFFGPRADEKIAARVGVVPFTLPAADAKRLLRSLAPTSSVRLARDVGDAVRVIDVTSIGTRRVILAEGSHRGVASTAHFARLPALLGVLRQYAAIDAYGFITVEPDLRDLNLFLHEPLYIPGTPILDGTTGVAQHAENVVADALPALIVGPAHRAKLGEIDPSWIEAISPTRSLLILPGQPDDWLPPGSDNPGHAAYESKITALRQSLLPVLQIATDPLGSSLSYVLSQGISPRSVVRPITPGGAP